MSMIEEAGLRARLAVVLALAMTAFVLALAVTFALVLNVAG